MEHTVRKAVIPVAGMGTRFLPATKAMPKELLPVVDKPVLQYIVEELTASGIEQIIFIISEDKRSIEKYFSHDPELEAFLKKKEKHHLLETIEHLSDMADFQYVTQDAPHGLGHAVLQAKEKVGNEPFIVCGGDDIIEADIPAAQQLIDVYTEHHGPVMGVMKVPKEATDRYGIADPAEKLSETVHTLQDIVEKPAVEDAPSDLAVGGRWLLTPEIFEILENTPPGAGNEIQLTDAIRELLKTQTGYARVYEGIYRDCGNKLEYVKAVIAFARKHPEIGPDIEAYLSTKDRKSVV